MAASLFGINVLLGSLKLQLGLTKFVWLFIAAMVLMLAAGFATEVYQRRGFASRLLEDGRELRRRSANMPATLAEPR